MKYKAVGLALAAAGLMQAGTAWAETTYSFSGFGTLGKHRFIPAAPALSP